MEIKIEWSELSEIQLKDIFDYYCFEAGEGTAKKIVNKIINRISILKNNPLAGQNEEILKEYSENFRYLVESNYKIIYWEKDFVITIASVFDCRQDPEKIKKI